MSPSQNQNASTCPCNPCHAASCGCGDSAKAPRNERVASCCCGERCGCGSACDCPSGCGCGG